MEIKDIINIVMKLSDSVNFYWNFYVVGVIAIIGWLISLKEHIKWQIKLLVSIGFLFFIILNIHGLLGSYTLLEASINELQESVNPSTFKTDKIFHTIKNISFSYYPQAVLGIHVVIDSGIFIAIWSNKVWSTLRLSSGRKTE